MFGKIVKFNRCINIDIKNLVVRRLTMPKVPAALLKEAKEYFDQLEQCARQLFPVNENYDHQVVLKMNDNGSVENVRTVIILGGIAKKTTGDVVFEPGIYIFFDQAGKMKCRRLDHSIFEYEPWKDNPKLLQEFIEKAKDVLSSQKKS